MAPDQLRTPYRCHQKVRRAPGQALSDFSIFQLIAHYWGCSEMFERWQTPEKVFQILKEITRGKPCEFTGIEGLSDD